MAVHHREARVEEGAEPVDRSAEERRHPRAQGLHARAGQPPRLRRHFRRAARRGMVVVNKTVPRRSRDGGPINLSGFLSSSRAARRGSGLAHSRGSAGGRECGTRSTRARFATIAARPTPPPARRGGRRPQHGHGAATTKLRGARRRPRRRRPSFWRRHAQHPRHRRLGQVHSRCVPLARAAQRSAAFVRMRPRPSRCPSPSTSASPSSVARRARRARRGTSPSSFVPVVSSLLSSRERESPVAWELKSLRVRELESLAD